MANPRTLDKRRKSVRNIKKITRTMELIATARFKQAMDRASEATAFTQRITQLVKDLTATELEFEHPLLTKRESKKKAVLLVLTANRGLCGGYNGNICRAAFPRLKQLQNEYDEVELRISGKKGISIFRVQRRLTADKTYLQFEDKPKFEDVEPVAIDLLESFQAHEIDRMDVAYMKFVSSSRQEPMLETLLPLSGLEGLDDEDDNKPVNAPGSLYEFVPSAESILQEVVPMSFKVKLFKCFLDAAVCEQIARMVAMKAATENANDLIKYLSREFNRARQSRITNEIMEIIGGVEALASS
ncbi:ATP synthase F1 subunit gamma [bacterium]|nr:ATP synthase F1 subunit gamma [bacterium]